MNLSYIVKNQKFKVVNIMNLKIYSKKVFTEFSYIVLTRSAKPVVTHLYNPIILNEDVIKDDPIVFAPNHRTTLDPFFIAPMISSPIHWAALKRFFTGEDSIFNNSKNPLLCNLTKFAFRAMGLIPIDRETSNEESIKIMDTYLKLNSSIGIFPEGTTNKKPNERNLLYPKSGAFYASKNADAWLQPISLVWAPDELKENVKNKVIVNFREPFRTSDMEISDIRDRWIEEVEKGIKENNEIFEFLGNLLNIDSLDNCKLLIKKDNFNS